MLNGELGLVNVHCGLSKFALNDNNSYIAVPIKQKMAHPKESHVLQRLI